MAESPYLLDNRQNEAGDRFEALAAVYDPMTIGHFDLLGVGPGWRCLEVGAGGGSIVRHLSDRVGPTGRVLATDLEPRFLDPLTDLENVDVVRHDIVVDPLPEAEFDLVHARLVLVHVPERLTALHRLVQSLRPGGWLLIEDGDGVLTGHSCLDPRTDDEHLANRMRSGLMELLAQRGVDFTFARSLFRLLEGEGLLDVAGDGYVAFSDTVRTLERANILQLREMYIESGIVTDAEVDRFLAWLDEPRPALAAPFLLSAWGRRAGGPA
ncbi:MAG TPA: methyltransferase domain-containing protein [Acidimicrobiia bacterium]|nr:methyltransferase domain-containing protein [Acidimicrobiia bacterium]